MRPKNLDLFLALGIALINVAWALLATYANLIHLTVIGIILALPLVFAVPGYTLTEVFFQRRSLEITHRLVFSLALSLAIAILSGFILNEFPTGLHTLPWALWLGLLTAVFSLIAFLRRRTQPAEILLPRVRLRISTVVLFGLAILVAFLSILYSVIGATQQSHPGFTQLGVLPATQAGNTCAVRISIQSFEPGPVKYRAVMTTNKTLTRTWPSISLAPKQQWNQIEPITVGTSTSLVIGVQLYRLDQPQTLYRHVDLTLHVSSKSSPGHQCTVSLLSPPYHDGALD